MLYSPAFTFSSVYPLVFLPCAGLRLGVLRQFHAFLASSPCAASATSYHFASIAPPPWRRAFSQFAPVVKLGFPVLASGSNCAVKPTRLRRAAYFRSLGQSMPSSSLWSQPGSFWLGAFMLAEAPIGLVVAFLDVEHRIIVLDYLFSSPLTIVCAIVGVVAVGLLTGWLGHRLGLGA